MRKYEILLLLQPNLDKEVKSKTLNKVKEIMGGTVAKEEEWGIKTLAYPIKKFNEAEYVLYYIEAEGQNVQELKDHIRITKEILRPLILVHEKDWPFNLKTSKELKFPERKPRPTRRPAPKRFEENKAEVKVEKAETNAE